jgi:putative transposase
MRRKVHKLDVDDAKWREAVVREAIVRPLASQERLSRVEIGVACRALGIRRSRLYALVESYRTAPVTNSLTADTPGPTKGSRRLSPEMEALIAEAIRDNYLTRQKPSVSALHDHVRQLCRARGLAAMPSWKAVRARVELIDRRLLIHARDGAKAARDRCGPVVHQYSADHALHVVQVDHTLVDLFVVDAVHRRPIQRPWLTLAIDVASRMVAGFYLSLEAPSSASVALAVHHVVTPKSTWLADRGVQGDWPVSGLPDVIHVDNAREFRGRALARGTAEHGITLIHRPVATPHYGGHIERLIGTVMGAIHLLPGTTFSNIAGRGAYNPEQHAVMTLDELERWLALQIVGRYHAQVHRGLHVPPIAAWQDAVACRRAPFRFPHDDTQFLYDFLPFEERSIRRDGVHLFGLRYWDDVLSPWAGRLERALRVKYDPRDLSRVFVEGPDGEHWPIRYADLRRPRITLGEHRLALAALKARGVRLTDEQLIFDTVEAQRELVETASKTTKSARRGVERRKISLTAAALGGRAEGEIADDEDIPEDLPMLAVEEWS